MDVSRGSVTKEPLAAILDWGMKNSWLGPYRDECIIGEHKAIIGFHNKAVSDDPYITRFCPSPSSTASVGPGPSGSTRRARQMKQFDSTVRNVWRFVGMAPPKQSFYETGSSPHFLM